VATLEAFARLLGREAQVARDRLKRSRDADGAEHYNYFRDYDPALGRYLQSDPIGLMGGTTTFAYVSGQPLAYIDPWGLCQMAVWQGGFIKGWVPCPGGQPPPRPPQPGPGGAGGGGGAGGRGQCQKCPSPYDFNIPDVNIPFHREDRLGGACFANCAIRAGLGLGAKEGGVAALEPGIAERFGHAFAKWCGRASLGVGLAILGNDLSTCKKTCTISTPVID
jgi:RHS repeat-associated protein